MSEPFAGGHTLVVDHESAFSDGKGRHKPSLERKQRKLLDKLRSLLGVVLEEGESVRFAAQAVSPFGIMEALTTGWVLQVAKRCALVVTDRRLLHVPAKMDFSPRASVAEVRFGDLAGWKASAFPRRLRLTYRSGKKEDFTALPRLAIDKLRALLPDPPQGDSTPQAERRHLCPSCAEPLVADRSPERCLRCSLEFKIWRRARRLSLLLPGGGYFYTGHPVMGLADALVEGILLLLVVFSLVEAASGDEEALVAAIIFGVLLALDKVVTLYHARQFLKEWIPADKAFTPVKR